MTSSVLPGEKFPDRDETGHFLFYDEQLERISGDKQRCSHALYVADYDRWPDEDDWERMAKYDWLADDAWERQHPPCPDCEGEGHHWAEGHEDEPGEGRRGPSGFGVWIERPAPPPASMAKTLTTTGFLGSTAVSDVRKVA